MRLLRLIQTVVSSIARMTRTLLQATLLLLVLLCVVEVGVRLFEGPEGEASTLVAHGDRVLVVTEDDGVWDLEQQSATNGSNRLSLRDALFFDGGLYGLDRDGALFLLEGGR